MKKDNKLQKLTLSALFLALAYLLPFFTGQIQEIGSMLCPMHLPILLCGFLCGPVWGLAVGFIAPLLRSLTLGMPPLFPKAICMALELATYGAISGLMHQLLPRKKPWIYPSLLISMFAGRLVWGGSMFLCLFVTGGAFSFQAFLAGAVTNAIPGIIVQMILVPIIVMIADKRRL